MKKFNPDDFVQVHGTSKGLLLRQLFEGGAKRGQKGLHWPVQLLDEKGKVVVESSERK